MFFDHDISLIQRNIHGGPISGHGPVANHLGGHHHHDHDHSHDHARGGAAQAEPSPPLVELARGGLTESIHRGQVAVCGPDGAVTRSMGHPAAPTYMRSAAKPLQALPVITSGAAEKYGFSPAELACMCGSLNGEDFQVVAVRAILGKADLSEDLLNCGVHRPSHRPTAKELAAQGLEYLPIHNNCAGKHAAMLVLCAHLGFETKGYIKPDHPVQRLILDEVAAMCAYPAEQIGLGIDGCGVPVFRVPLHNLAGAYARLAAPKTAGLSTEKAQAVEQLMTACLAHPEMIAGSGRLCTRLMQAHPGAFLAKTGSEGSYALALPEKSLGVAFNIEDGAPRALGPVACQVLHQLGYLSHDILDGELKDVCQPELKNHRGEVVATLKTVFRLPGEHVH